jgi:hypothetical protein
VLIAARALVNGATVLPDPTWQCVEYVHIACDAHDVLVAEGAPAESLPPRGNLSAFAGGAVMLLHPGFAEAGPAGSDCAPRLNSGPAVREARQALLERARLLGHGITHDPDLHLLVDGVRIDPSGSAGALRRFLVPPEAGDIRILSRAGVPAELEALSEDRRRLGVMLGGIVVRGTFGVMHLPPEHPALREGFHVAERRGAACVRWTDGHARLPPCPPTPSRLELQVLAVQPAWARAAVPDAPANRIA